MSELSLQSPIIVTALINEVKRGVDVAENERQAGASRKDNINEPVQLVAVYSLMAQWFW